jgi:hypothetical protein
MLLKFLGDIGVYLPEKDAIKFTALSGGDALDCFVTRSALDALGCDPKDRPEILVDRFEHNRALLERAAVKKYHRSRPGSPVSLECIDLQGLSQDLTRGLPCGFSRRSFDMEG